MKVRRMLESDLPKAIALVEANNHSLVEEARHDIPQALANPDYRFYVAEGGGEVVGMMGHHPDRWGVADIRWSVWLYVDPQWKRQGIATSLYRIIEREMRELGCRKAYLEVGNEAEHRAAIEFHKANGYVLEGSLRDFWEDGEDCLIFGKRLAPVNGSPGGQRSAAVERD